DEGPAEMIAVMREWIENGWVNILGGCCGTTPEHIAVFAEAAAGAAPRKPAPRSSLPRFAGLEPLVIRGGAQGGAATGPTSADSSPPTTNLASSAFINVGERTNLTGS